MEIRGADPGRVHGAILVGMFHWTKGDQRNIRFREREGVL